MIVDGILINVHIFILKNFTGLKTNMMILLINLKNFNYIKNSK